MRRRLRAGRTGGDRVDSPIAAGTAGARQHRESRRPAYFFSGTFFLPLFSAM
jgi:hypothetical protein